MSALGGAARLTNGLMLRLGGLLGLAGAGLVAMSAAGGAMAEHGAGVWFLLGVAALIAVVFLLPPLSRTVLQNGARPGMFRALTQAVLALILFGILIGLAGGVPPEAMAMVPPDFHAMMPMAAAGALGLLLLSALHPASGFVRQAPERVMAAAQRPAGQAMYDPHAARTAQADPAALRRMRSGAVAMGDSGGSKTNFLAKAAEHGREREAKTARNPVLRLLHFGSKALLAVVFLGGVAGLFAAPFIPTDAAVAEAESMKNLAMLLLVGVGLIHVGSAPKATGVSAQPAFRVFAGAMVGLLIGNILSVPLLTRTVPYAEALMSGSEGRAAAMTVEATQTFATPLAGQCPTLALVAPVGSGYAGAYRACVPALAGDGPATLRGTAGPRGFLVSLP